jgi:hypothetical protein
MSRSGKKKPSICAFQRPGIDSFTLLRSRSGNRNHLIQEFAMVYLQIILNIAPANRPQAAQVYQRYKTPFLETIAGAKSKELLVRDEDVQVLHGFDTLDQAQAYLKSDLFNADVVVNLKPLLASAPDIRIYQVA